MSKLYRGECRSYSIDELAEDAKQYAYHKWYQTAEYHGTDEIKATLNEFCRLFDVRCYSWEFDAYSHHFRFGILNDTLTCFENISGIRLATYIWNNYAQYITKGKYFSLWSKTERSEHNPAIRKLKSRHSRVMLSMEDCPLTGGCYDCNVLEPVIKCLSYQKLYNSYTELIEDCLDGLFLAAQKECEYVYSMEYFIDEARNNEYEYCSNGSAFRLPGGFVEVA